MWKNVFRWGRGCWKRLSSIKERKNISINGYLEINIIINSNKLKKTLISLTGIPRENNEENLFFEIEDEVNKICKTFSLQSRNQEKNLIETLKQNCRKVIREKTGKKPFTKVNVTKI